MSHLCIFQGRIWNLKVCVWVTWNWVVLYSFSARVICRWHLSWAVLAGWNITLAYFIFIFQSDFLIWDDCRREHNQIKIYLDHPKVLMRRSWVPCLSLLQLPVFRHSRWNISIKMIPYPRLPPTLSSSQTIISRDIVCCQNQEQEEQKSRAELSQEWIPSPGHSPGRAKSFSQVQRAWCGVGTEFCVNESKLTIWTRMMGCGVWGAEKTCLCLWEAVRMKRGSSFRERWKGSGKTFFHRSGTNGKNWDWWKLNWAPVYLESSPANCPEKCMETNLVDDDEEEIDNSFKPSTLRRSFRRMRKAVKWDIM